MKKNLINRFAVLMITAVLSMATADTFAAFQPVKMDFTVHPDTPYLAIVEIYKTGLVDTPYLSLSIQPAMPYSQLKALNRSLPGSYHVIITYINKEGVKIDEEDYYLDNPL